MSFREVEIIVFVKVNGVRKLTEFLWKLIRVVVRDENVWVGNFGGRKVFVDDKI